MAVNPGLTGRSFWRHSPTPSKEDFEDEWKAIAFSPYSKEISLQTLLRSFFKIGVIDNRKMDTFMADYSFNPIIKCAYKSNLALVKVRGGVPFRQTYMYKVFMEYLEEKPVKGGKTSRPPAETSIAEDQDDSAVAHLLLDPENNVTMQADSNADSNQDERSDVAPSTVGNESCTSNVNVKTNFARGVMSPDLTATVEIVMDNGDLEEYTRLCAYVFVCKYAINDAYSTWLATSRIGTSQLLLYSSLNYEMSKMWLGAVFINSAFSRVCALNKKEFLIEVSNDLQVSKELTRTIMDEFIKKHENLSINGITKMAQQFPKVSFDLFVRDDGLPGSIAWELSDPAPSFDESGKREALSKATWKLNDDAWKALLQLRDLTERVTLNIPISGPLSISSEPDSPLSVLDDVVRPLRHHHASFGIEGDETAGPNAMPADQNKHAKLELDPDDSCSNTGADEDEDYATIKDVLIRAGVTVRYVSPAFMSLFLEARSRCVV